MMNRYGTSLCVWGIAIALAGCTVGNLVFKRTADQSAVAKTQVLNGTTWIPASSDIAGALATCLDDLTVGLTAVQLPATRITPAPRTELRLYARSPNDMMTFLSGLTRDDVLQGLSTLGPNDVAQGVWNAKAATPGGFARALVVTWPAAVGAATGPEVTQALSSTAFWGPRFAPGLSTELSLCHPNGNAGLLQPGGTLHEAELANRGTCRREVALGGFVGSGNSQLVQAVHDRRAPGVGRHKVRYSILQSAIRDPGGAIDAPIASLFLLLMFEATDLLGNATSPVWGTINYEFDVNNGRVQLTPHEIAWHYSGIWGPETSEGLAGQPGWHQALTTSDGQMITQINAQILDMQLLGVQNQLIGAQLTGGNFGCDDATFLQKCGAAADSMAQTLGALIRRRKAGSAPMFSDGEVTRMLCALGESASCTKLGTNRDDVLRARWACTTSSISQDRYCDMVIPAARLVAAPDSLGVVFFDRDELDNAAYALEAASPGALCAADGAVPASRSFVSSVIVDR
jgi:hypothetical protein